MYKKYKHSKAATLVSILSSANFAICVFLVVGFIFDWDSMRSTMNGDDLIAYLMTLAFFALIGFLLNLWAERIARNKERKLAEKAAAASPAHFNSLHVNSASLGTASRSTMAEPSSRAAFCTRCGAKAEPGAKFCCKCGNRL